MHTCISLLLLYGCVSVLNYCILHNSFSSKIDGLQNEKKSNSLHTLYYILPTDAVELFNGE